MSPTRKNMLNDDINACSIAEVGKRSDRDFALCCWAISQGLDQEEIWGEVQKVGKFEEEGWRYFDRTWKKARGRVCEQIYDRVASRAGVEIQPSTNGVASTSQPGHGALESDEDPARLARLHIKLHCSHADDKTLAYHEEEFKQWDGCKYRIVPPKEV